MRRAKLAEIGDTPVPGNAGDIGAQLAQMLAGLDQITAIQRAHEQFVTAFSTINTRLDQIEKSLAHLKQYETDHNELHKLMAAAQGENMTSVQKTLALAVTSHQQTMETSIQQHSQQVATTLAANMENTRSMIAAMAQAIEQATGKDIDVHMPEIKLPERKLLDYDIIRGANSLLSKIREVEQ